MPTVVTEQGVVHYEVLGRGEPVILLHGWLGSWGYWLEAMKELSSKYGVYALDFWGFGESDRRRESFRVEDFIWLVMDFMDKLGIHEASLVGHSMGGTVALSVALRRPEKIRKVGVVGSPIDGKSLSFLLKMAAIPQLAFMAWNNPWFFRMLLRAMAPRTTRPWQQWYEMLLKDLSRVTLASFFQSINSLYHTDLRPYIGQIKTDVFGIYGLRDNIVAPSQAKLVEKIPGAKVHVLPQWGHFPMLDDPPRFNQLLLTNIKGGKNGGI
mgnify:CR=1 FL=1